MGRIVFSEEFIKVKQRYKCTGCTCNLNVMRQSTCLLINPITVNHFADFFNCMPVDAASDSIIAPTKTIYFSFYMFFAWSSRVQLMILFCFRFSVVVLDTPGNSRCRNMTLYLSGPRICFIILFNHHLFVHLDGLLTS